VEKTSGRVKLESWNDIEKLASSLEEEKKVIFTYFLVVSNNIRRT